MLLISIVIISAFVFYKAEKYTHKRVFNQLRDEIILKATIANRYTYRDKITDSGLSTNDKIKLYQFLNQTIEAVGYEAAGEIR